MFYICFQCSVTCGEGRKTRLTICINRNGVHLADSYCKGRKPRNSKTCKQGKCPHWNTSEWGKVMTVWCSRQYDGVNMFYGDWYCVVVACLLMA